MAAPSDDWPALPFAAWQDSCATLQLWTQIVGKIRLAQTPWLNHSWHTTLYVTARGLTTSLIPYGSRTFSLDFDFVEHQLLIRTDGGAQRSVALRPRSVADFYAATKQALRELGIDVRISRQPNEIPGAVPFDQDTVHAFYDAHYVQRFWRVLVQVDRVFKAFRTGFVGKVSPVHFFWGSFDLAVTRFSGRRAPLHPGGIPNLPDAVVREAYSHEVSSAGFWPGGGDVDAAFYSYAYPEPPGFAAAKVAPAPAAYSDQLKEFLLPYEAVRIAPDPDSVLMAFLISNYEAAANLGQWDRAALECALGVARRPRKV